VGGTATVANSERAVHRPLVAPQNTVVDQHAKHFLEEERVSLGGSEDSIPHLTREPSLTEEVGDQASALACTQGRQDHGRPGERRPTLARLRTRHAQEEDGSVTYGGLEMLEQIEECRLRPVDVVEDDDQRAVGGEGLEEPPDGPEALVRV
jgi:hypothetical protein